MMGYWRSITSCHPADLSPIVVAELVVRLSSTRLKLPVADAAFRSLCCKNAFTIAEEPLSFKTVVCDGALLSIPTYFDRQTQIQLYFTSQSKTLIQWHSSATATSLSHTYVWTAITCVDLRRDHAVSVSLLQVTSYLPALGTLAVSPTSVSCRTRYNSQGSDGRYNPHSSHRSVWSVGLKHNMLRENCFSK